MIKQRQQDSKIKCWCRKHGAKYAIDWLFIDFDNSQERRRKESKSVPAGQNSHISVQLPTNWTLWRVLQRQQRAVYLGAKPSFPAWTKCNVRLDLTAHAVLWIGLQNHQQGAGRSKMCSVRFVVRNSKRCDAVERHNAGSNPLRTRCAATVPEDHGGVALLWNWQRSNNVCKSCSGTVIALMTSFVWMLRTRRRRWGLIHFYWMSQLMIHCPFFGEAQSLLLLLLLQCPFLMHSHAARRSAAAPFLLIHHPVWPAMFISANRFWFFSRYFRQSLHQHTICPLSSLRKC